MTYTGAWKASTNFYYDPLTGKVHTADPAHAVTNAADPVAYVYTAPLGLDYTEGEMVPEYPGAEWVTQEPGRIGDMTPVSHSGGDTGPTFATDQEMQADALARHSVDYGGSHAYNFDQPDFRGYTETFDMVLRAGDTPEPPATVNPVALQRGLNGLPENNPEGWRAGHIDWYRPNRKFYEGQRSHDARPLVPNVAQLGTDQPPVPTPYGNPFSSLARAMTTVNNRPMLRREPTPMSQDVTTDGSFDGDVYAGDWMVG